MLAMTFFVQCHRWIQWILLGISIAASTGCASLVLDEAPPRVFDSPDAYGTEGWKSIDEARPSLALHYFEQAINLEPRGSSYHLGAAISQLLIGRPKDAGRAFRRVMDLDPRSPEAALAGQFLEKLAHPLPVVVAWRTDMEAHAGTLLRKRLEDSGLYSIPERWQQRKEAYQTEAQACATAREDGAKVLILVESAAVAFSERALEGSAGGILGLTSNFPVHDCRVALKIAIYSTKTGRAEESLNASAEARSGLSRLQTLHCATKGAVLAASIQLHSLMNLQRGGFVHP